MSMFQPLGPGFGLEAREIDIAQPMPEPAFAELERAFFAGQNFELAEQWSDAMQSYKTVLRSANEHVPIKAAAERLKVLTKEHPEAVAAAGPASQRNEARER